MPLLSPAFQYLQGRSVHITNNSECAGAFAVDRQAKHANRLTTFMREAAREGDDTSGQFSADTPSIRALDVDAPTPGDIHDDHSGSSNFPFTESQESACPTGSIQDGSSSISVVQTDLGLMDLNLEDILQPDELEGESEPEEMEDDDSGIKDDDYNDANLDETASDISEPLEAGSTSVDTSNLKEPCFDEATEYTVFSHPGAAKVFTLTESDRSFSRVSV